MGCSGVKVKINDQEGALLECKLCRDKIKQYIKSLETREKKEKDKVKELLKNKEKERAKFYLRQAKMHEKQITNAENQLGMITDQITRIESAFVMKECKECLVKGNEVIKELQSQIKVEEWENIKDDMDELKQKDKEISDFIKNYGINENEYNNECDNELNKLIVELNLGKEYGTNVIDLPSAVKENDTKKVENKKKEKVLA